MAAQGARMRLTVVVEALAEENAHGEYRDAALAAFKERKFAMPVQLEDTFAAVWGDIEQRYKTNYLSPQQAATFAIKKLQDAYDCDLDMTDTVGAIFEGEPDRKMHLIKVVPYFVYRDTSVVPGSMLRPAGAQKRAGDDADVDDAADGAHKRRRVESQRPGASDPRDPSPDRPLPSTEVRQAAAALETHAPRNPLPVRLSRSRSGASLVELRRTETGQAPFSPTPVKQESPEPGQLEQPVQTEQPAAVPTHAASPQRESPEATIHKSPLSSVEPAPAPVANPRRDVYRVPSSPEFMHTKTTPDKPAKTYGRSPRSAAPNSLKTPARTTAAKPTKPGSLKKPSRASLVTTPASRKCGAKPKAVTTPVNNPGPKRKTLTPSTVNPSSGEKNEGHAEHEIYSTAIEDNTSRSHSSSANASARSSPAVSRRPARFLSHSPTPDASESEGDPDDASLTPSRAASPPAQSRDESASESESSSDSSEDEDIEMPDLQAEPIAESSLNAAPASSPPLAGFVNSTPAVPETSQVTASGINHPAMRTPIPLPSQQSSQTPRSSQSVSLQAADRRRYTGFRSLREQLADTKAAQITTQKRAFDPRTMSLGRLTKGKPLASLGGGDEDDESSDDESSSSSSD
ncbi:hypothetical protein C7974DRAFT_445521, partial [Boeremia exigua]|uniref:uncharacterized protein n=1 Tax=Boeremia exigua TaxID=749465 RepID=UPI001E8CFD17